MDDEVLILLQVPVITHLKKRQNLSFENKKETLDQINREIPTWDIKEIWQINSSII